MFDVPDPLWPTVLLAAILLGDALISIRPPRFVTDCLDGVGFPLEWGWTLVYIKVLATAGLLVGLAHPGIAAATNAAVIGYFLAAAYSHIRARFLGSVFWFNCLGMLALSVAVFVGSYLV
ncbi:DoxX family protein [Lolliginicoccus suaedae]|uniref:DoxX family protein n=1 Tax=Lolliginicoccus suaedae TaxID=2605429 RepID=UPI0011F06E48|nr:DoxX family protein [Lolliginicoccus suaedae]